MVFTSTEKNPNHAANSAMPSVPLPNQRMKSGAMMAWGRE
jgi:hypothetical protein